MQTLSLSVSGMSCASCAQNVERIVNKQEGVLKAQVNFGVENFFLFGGPLLNPMIAAIAMSFSSISVLLNVLRIKKMRFVL